ncbi:DUF4328 domain-containing protein [Streptomyces sp. CRN 30]|uniref:DUF4328 domain-containing protein n=1 Tax=Streptomyces sp. CRN 30 TaxID=3075613 RepID=UPI002A801C62|nr:DUF4328 domain-containing protein [Streptomyces sp. CRN 30]
MDTGLVNAWWTLWLVSTAFSRISHPAYDEAATAPEIRRALGQVVFADSHDLVAAVVAAVFVLTLTRMQDAKARGVPGAPVATPAAG